MATHRVSLLNGTIRPLDSNTWFAPYSTANSGTTQDPFVLFMKSAVVGVVKGNIRIPENYVGTPVLSIIWTSETTADTVDFKFRHRTTSGSDTALLDISSSPDERADSEINNTGPSAASEQMIDVIDPLTATDLAAGDLMYFEFERDGVTDDKAGDITVWSLDFQYADA